MFAIGRARKRYEHEMKRSGEYRQGLDMGGIYEDFFFPFLFVCLLIHYKELAKEQRPLEVD